MDIRDQIDYYLNTAFKRVREQTPHAGTNIIELAEWSRTEGFIKKNVSLYDSVTAPGPVIAIVDEKIRENNLTLTIYGRVAEKAGTETWTQIGMELTKDVYEKGSEIVQAYLEIPRFTGKSACWLISGLGNKIYEITDITANVDIFGEKGGKVKFYVLASVGSQLIWLLGMYKIHNMIKKILNSIWLAPTTCPYCNGTGIDPNTGDTCPQCLSYGYSGYNAEKSIQIDKGYDVRLTREKFSDYPVTNAQNAKIWEFVNKCWTQKWWVTPTISEIKRMFAHFYNVRKEDIIITERYHHSMPHWQINLPLTSTLGAPFEAGDTDLAEYIARSVTPAGVSVFVGFYGIEQIGDLDDFLEQGLLAMKVKPKILTKKFWEMGSLSYNYDDWNSRFRCYNGWIEAVDNFESSGVALSGIWQTSGAVDIFNANDRFRHVARLKGNGSSMSYMVGTYDSGHVDFWIHPESSTLRCSILTTGLQELYWVEYNQSQSGFVDSSKPLLNIFPDNDSHISIYYDQNASDRKTFINKTLLSSGNTSGNVGYIKFHNTTTGTGFIDGFGITNVIGYTKNKNWQTLYPWGWGLNHLDCLSGISGLLYNYFLPDILFNTNVSGVC